MDFEVLEGRFVTDWKIKDPVQSNCATLSRCPAGWSGYTCEIAAAPVDSSASGGSKSHSSDHIYQKASPACSHPVFLQVQPPSSSLCFCCCCWRCWRLAPSCGIGAECEGEAAFQTLGANSSFFLICFSHLRYLSCFSLLFLFDNHLFPVSQVSMAGQISFTIFAVTSQGYITQLFTHKPSFPPLISSISASLSVHLSTLSICLFLPAVSRLCPMGCPNGISHLVTAEALPVMHRELKCLGLPPSLCLFC